MKVILVLFVLICLGLTGVYYVGFSGFSPEEQISKIKREVKVGMDWDQVVDVHTPRKYEPISLDTMNGRRQAQKFEREAFGKAVEAGHFGDGFVFPYHFSGKDAIEVIFDGDGKVIELVRPKMMSDLLAK